MKFDDKTEALISDLVSEMGSAGAIGRIAALSVLGECAGLPPEAAMETARHELAATYARAIRCKVSP